MDNSNVGKLLPNITVTVRKDKDGDESHEEGEISDGESITDYSDDDSKKDIVRNWMDTLQVPKSYHNKLGGFETGIDLSSPSLIKKLEERAERFGLDKKERSQITQLEIDSLYESLGLDPRNLKSSCRNIRLKVIHIRGVTEMNTKEVLDYFIGYGPSTIEWINDISCNVCFADETSAARALLGLSKPFVVKKRNQNYDSSEKTLEETDVIEMTDSDEGTNESEDEANVRHQWKFKRELELDAEEKALDDDAKMEVDQKDSNSDDNKTADIDMPVPPGHWRLGIPHKKAKAILLRFATYDDKKAPGAEKRSQYYQKYGNPNYGGLKGLISTSRKRRFQSSRNKEFISEISAGSSSRYDPDFIPDYEKRSKVPRMKMYADEEEEKRKRIGRRDFSRATNVKDRLGIKYTADDLHYISQEVSDDSSDEELSVNCKIPSKFKIWNDQARLMAEADKRRDQMVSYRHERPQTSRAVDYRATVKSSVHKVDASEGDLRSRIKTLKEDKPNKHRSPLCKDSD